jgi:hypothetical protein
MRRKYSCLGEEGGLVGPRGGSRDLQISSNINLDPKKAVIRGDLVGPRGGRRPRRAQAGK